MNFYDNVDIKVVAGKGGDGKISFRSELYVPHGGPDGGNGGKGGSVYFKACESINDFQEFKFKKKFIAEDGEDGRNKKQTGKNGQDLVIKVPIGTIIKSGDKIIAEFTTNKDEAFVAKGGRYGRGNAMFASSTNRTPTLSENGSLGEFLDINLELKIIANVGLIGFPNGGKSTLLNSLTNAHSKVAKYAFTTLNPVLGTIYKNNKKIVIADIPGIIKDAYTGKGLGLKFLSHIEHCEILVIVLDFYDDPDKKYEVLLNELSKYNPKIIKKEIIICLNKTEDINEKTLKNETPTVFKNKEVIYISGLKKTNLEKLISQIFIKYENFLTHKNNSKTTEKVYTYKEMDKSLKIIKINNFKYKIKSKWLEKIVQKIPLNSFQNINRLNGILTRYKINEKLENMGAKEGSIIIIGKTQLEKE